jgi:hypothetical protein
LKTGSSAFASLGTTAMTFTFLATKSSGLIGGNVHQKLCNDLSRLNLRPIEESSFLDRSTYRRAYQRMGAIPVAGQGLGSKKTSRCKASLASFLLGEAIY